MIIVTDAPGTLDWATPPINLLRKGSSWTTKIPPKKDSHSNYMANKRGHLGRPMAPIGEKLAAAQTLVEKLLQMGHIEVTHCP
jgi:hypothetical protein